MHSQRQKKRHSQFKKKRYDDKAGKESDDGVKRKESIKKTDELDKRVNGAGPIVIDKGYENKQKYSKRKVDSNWEKYNENEPHYTMDENALEQRLAQLLFIHPSNKVPPIIEPSLPVPPTRDDKDESGPKLDLAALATTLSTLSLHERLLLDKDLIHKCEREYESTVKEASSLREQSNEHYTPLSGINLDFKTKLAKITKETSDHTSQTIGHDKLTDQELEKVLQVTANQEVLGNTLGEKKRDFFPQVEQDTTADSELDAMLDELLN